MLNPSTFCILKENLKEAVNGYSLTDAEWKRKPLDKCMEMHKATKAAGKTATHTRRISARSAKP